MANYHTWTVTAKTFRVKDPEKFVEDLENNAQVTEAQSDYHGLHYDRRNDGTFWLGGHDADLVVHLPAGDSVTEVDVAEIVREHIQEEQTAIFKVVGQEKLRGVSGAVIVVKSFGVESRTLDELGFKLEEKMNPLKQGVKEALSTSKTQRSD